MTTLWVLLRRLAAKVRELYADQQRLRWVLLLDCRLAARSLVRDRATSLAAVALLTLGVGAAVVMADTLDRLLVRPPSHVSAPERVARLYDETDGTHPSAMITNYATIARLAGALQEETEYLAGYMEERLGLGRGADARALRAIAHTETYFDVLGLTPAIGVLPSSRGPQTPDAAVISHALWQQRFGGAREVIGRPLRIGKRVYTLVAVTPRGFVGIDTDAVDVWLPLESRASEGSLNRDWRTSPDYFMLSAIARLRAGVSRPAAEARASAAFNAGPARIWADGKPRKLRILFGELLPARQPRGTSEVRVIVWIGAVSLLVFLIACGNVGNVLFLRGLRRNRALALKAALGATRGRLAREILIEAAMLAMAAAGLAVGVVLFAGTAVRRLLLPPVLGSVSPFDLRLLMLTFIVCGTAAFLLGIVPAFRLTARRLLSPGQVAPAASSRVLDVFVALQVAFSVPLIAGASLFCVSFWQARQVNFGLDSSNVAVIAINADDVASHEQNHALHRRIQERIAQLPEVQFAPLVQMVPLVGGYGVDFFADRIRLGTYQAPFLNGVDPAYFQAMGQRFVAGRPFTSTENVPNGRRVIVINQALAREFWPGESPIGRCAYVLSERTCTEVIGVVADSAMWPILDGWRDVPSMCFVPLEQRRDVLDGRALLVRTRRDPHDLLPLFRREAQAVDADLPYADVWAFDDVFQPALRPLRLGSTVFVAFGLAALVIATFGLAAVTANGVVRRKRELGIRLVLGAQPHALVGRMVAGSASTVIIGLVAGSVIAYAGSRAVQSLLFGVSPTDPVAFAVSVGTLLSAGVLAAYIPARRVARIEPAVTLRAE